MNDAAPGLRVLVVDGALPDAGSNAGDRASTDLMEGIVACAHMVMATALGISGAESRAAPALTAIGIPVADGSGGGPQHLRRLLAEGDWDVVVVGRPGPGLLALPVLQEFPSVARVYWGSDLHAWRLGAQADVTGSVAPHQLRLAVLAEQRCWAGYDLAVYPSEREVVHINAMHPATNPGRATPYFRLDRDDLVAPAADLGGTGVRSGALMVGAPTHAPNLDAAQVAVTEILPLMRQADPTAHITIVGDWPADTRRGLQAPGVHFTGRVSDARLRALHASHLCLLAPLRFGGGTRRKIVAAMGLGLPVVTTPEGVRGLLVRDAGPADGVLVAEGAPSLAQCVVHLGTDPALWSKSSQTAHAAAEAVYSRRAFDAGVDRVLAAALRRSSLRTRTP